MKSKLAGFKTLLLALLVMALWGSLFPCVKIGYKAFFRKRRRRFGCDEAVVGLLL